ncbi:transglutaminase domain-containing protein [Flagellimonas meridianipacifica]|uniref:Transglutaminase superfamily protein n=1 Tax=Flagellimonas meridianipacifica TaxID=1080225 RepID=A0A2T0MK28_9FLAO|nr:transglutaminase domain-containing protein [Allomuricauda pacifica]PRX57856.1 transglutaminase superfamily protein [Allomuricauda pacifica]
MSKSLLITIFVLLGTLNCTLGQEIKFGKVSDKELTQESYMNDNSASAAILYKKQDTYLISSNGESRLVTEIHERIKIYTKEGFEYATKEINLYKNRSAKEQVKKLKAVTYNLENGKVVETELGKDEVFETDLSYNYNQVKFTMPNVKEGSILEFSYRVNSPFIWNIDEFRFQYDIPVHKMFASIRTPKGFRFRQTPKGYYSVYPKKYTRKDNRIGMDVVVNEYTVTNMPAMKAESYVDNIHNYRSGVMFELVSVELPGFFRSYAQSWKDVAQTIGSSDDYKNELDKTRSFDDELDNLLANETSQVDKMKAIFKYVKSNISWNGLDGKYFFNGLKKTLKEKKGNAADINLLLVAMLRYAGIDANPVIISTKDNLIPFFPTVDRLNYVLAYAKINDKPYFMDGTEEFSDINVLPIKDYNWKGILVDNNRKQWKQINLISPGTSSNMYSLNVDLNEDGSAEGTCKARFDRHSALNFRNGYKSKDMESFLSAKESMLSDIEIDEYNAENAENYEGRVGESFSFFNDYGADEIDGKLYLKPLGFLAMGENPFKVEERVYPVDFGFPFKDVYMVKLNLPEGYKIESCPESKSLKLPDGLGLFRFNITPRENEVDVMVNFEIKSSIIAPSYYPLLKEFFNQVITKESEQLVLSKI